MRYRIEAAPGVRFMPQEVPGEPATISIVFQRAGDNWSGRGRSEFFRWYAPPSIVQQIAPGERARTVRLDDADWCSVQGTLVPSAPHEYREALAAPGSIGIVFGSAGLRGHGVYATGPARFRLISFEVR